MDEMSLNTILTHDEKYPEGSITPPIYQSSLFAFTDYDSMIERFEGKSTNSLYSRVDNPTVKTLEKKIAQLEHGDGCIAFSSGMAAISNAILSVVKPGDKIVCVNHVYPDAYRFMRGFCQRFGMETVFVDGTSLSAIESAIEGAALLYLESPNSWVMEEQNLSAIAEIAKRKGVVTAIDNSWASPLYQNPLDLGVDIVIHSASKYISGHSDVVAGLVISSQPFIDKIKKNISPFLGGKLSAFEAWLILRGLRTIHLRMERHQENSLYLAQKLLDHPYVVSVMHPGMNTSETSSLKGFSGLFSINVKEQVNIKQFCNALEIFRMGVSWGGYESLVMPAISVLNQEGEFNSAKDFGVSPQTIRLSIGLEDKDDLWKDIRNAIDKATL
ncbi:aminotransferase class I/II-fold pyridoxal phosphate-dependent enzyme [Vibrio sp.]|uniref:Aminotransferase class I/II-fold pyridoxal phosphate-dependent enzyme n=1 Tax=Vibrio viridaestus TaxID=2487322 RepID=A0A3N9U4I3_9VIBR|nr:aminotransferase class I/II-fold pyridoxal phosphate-dependent enzyme [Vibrio viridaestus]MDC0611732.1 aminotransferase class I/II-fold pyridoxal phosphate-dependent enzyme [Vibrio sp.]RQW64512.1 aminotransferase class I/II-fold pyridoxal phosphate-dependent enzyme [Vibrio viridaestus]